MNTTARLSAADRNRSLIRLRTLTVGTTVLGFAAVGGFGAIAAISNPGMTAADSSTTAVTAAIGTSTSASTSVGTASGTSSSAASTSTPTATPTLQPSATAATAVTGGAQVSSGGSGQ